MGKLNRHEIQALGASFVILCIPQPCRSCIFTGLEASNVPIWGALFVILRVPQPSDLGFADLGSFVGDTSYPSARFTPSWLLVPLQSFAGLFSEFQEAFV